MANIYVTGEVASNTFPTVNPVQPFFNGSNDILHCEARSNRQEILIYSTYFGSWGDDQAKAIAVGC